MAEPTSKTTKKPATTETPTAKSPAKKAAAKTAKSAESTAKKTAAAKAPSKATITKAAAAKKPAAPKKAAIEKKPAVKRAMTPGVLEIDAPKVMIVSDEQRYRMVAEAAYYRAESNHFRSDPIRDWVEAEKDIAALLSGGTR